MSRRRPSMRQIFVSGGALALMLASGACSSNNKGLPTNLPNISLNSTATTPPHSMPSYDYPFDSSGNYVTSWAAEGERRSGRSAASSSSSRSRYTSSTRSRSSSATKKSSSSSTRYHKVRGGDTLYGIARRYGSSVAKIKSANGLRSDIIRVGITLKIPR